MVMSWFELQPPCVAGEGFIHCAMALLLDSLIVDHANLVLASGKPVLQKISQIAMTYLKIPVDGVDQRIGFRHATDVDGVTGPDQALVGRVDDLKRDSRCDWKKRYLE